MYYVSADVSLIHVRALDPLRVNNPCGLVQANLRYDCG